MQVGIQVQAMAPHAPSRMARLPQCRTLNRFRRAEDGTTAIEFGMVAFPFLIFVLGILAVGLQFFTINSLDHAVEVVSRQIRTGQAQTVMDADGNTMTLAQFRNAVCSVAGRYIERDCNERVKVHIQSGNNWAAINPRPCAQAGVMTDQAGNDSDTVADTAGGAGQVVLVTVCYDWELPIHFPMLNRILMTPPDGVPLTSGGSLVQAVATFRTEPYE